MSAAWIRTRENSDGSKSFQVLYRRGGRNHPIHAAGSFRGWPAGKKDGKPVAALSAAEKDARTRRDMIAGWLATAMDPAVELERLVVVTGPRLTLSAWCDLYWESRVDLASESRRSQVSHVRKIKKTAIAARHVDTITFSDIVGVVDDWSTSLTPASILGYMGTLRLVLDFAGADPNPARDKRVKLPTVAGTDKEPPDAEHFLALVNALPRKFWLPVVVLEQTGMRIGEIVSLTWADVDELGCRFRLRKENVKTRKARWVPVPGWLMSIVADLVPREDRDEARRVFKGLSEAGTRHAMTAACLTAGIPAYTPHQLRHRRGTLWHHNPDVSLREQMSWGGWSKADVAVETYSHVQRLDEVPQEALERLLVLTP